MAARETRTRVGLAVMQGNEVISHFWVAGPPFFSTTLLVASATLGEPGSSIAVSGDLYDVDGALAQGFQVEFPERETGVIELEPFLSSLKMQSGITQGHLVVRSRAGTTHLCRVQSAGHVDLIKSPIVTKSREMTFMPLLLGVRREHLVTLVNVGDHVGQVVVRLLYSTRSPEWTVHVPAHGCRVISLEHDLLTSFDDSSWKKGVLQGYLRISPRAQSEVVCQMIEKLPAEGEDSDAFRMVTSW